MTEPSSAVVAPLGSWLLLGLLFGVLLWPYQALSELGFRLQRGLWLAPQPQPLLGCLLVFGATSLLVLLAWGPLAGGRGGGTASLLALDRAPDSERAGREERWLQQLSLATQLRRLPLMLLTHLGGLAVGVESPSVALGASVLLAIRRRWPGLQLLASLSPQLVAVIGGAAGLGAAFRSPLLAVAYGLEELGQRRGLPLVLPALLLAGSGTLVATTMGQPARLPGLELGPLPPEVWGWAAVLTLVGAAAGALLVRLLLPAAAAVKRLLAKRRLVGAVLLASSLTLLALASGGLSLNDGSLSLAAALSGDAVGPPAIWLWRLLSSVLSLALGAPGGLMHDSMTLGALLISPLQGLPALDSNALAQLAAVGATALFAGAHGCPLFCAAFVFTLQGDPGLLPLLLLVSAVAAALGERWRGEGWNDHQVLGLLDQNPSATPSSR
ncbi:chloride channel protein [Vulcanococcus limneticus]|uniref:chloride channel protein n=1 Tax=Vulcanococcus limneticus TaxID=2170428 RepID=UPI00398BE6F9